MKCSHTVGLSTCPHFLPFRFLVSNSLSTRGQWVRRTGSRKHSFCQVSLTIDCRVSLVWWDKKIHHECALNIFILMPLPQTSSSLTSQLLLLVPWSVRWAYTFPIALLVQLHGNSSFIESVLIYHGRSLLIVYQIQYWCKVPVGVLGG